VRNNGLKRPAAPEIYVPAAVLGVNPMNVVVPSMSGGWRQFDG